jgi:hypothetical protein
MCDSCNPGGINRRQFVGRTLKASGLFSLAMAGGYGAMGTGIFFGESSLSSADNSLAKLKKEPARVKVVFLYPPADVVNAGKNEDNWAPEHWFTWPGNQFEPEMQERVFTSKIESIAARLGVVADFAPRLFTSGPK